MKRFGIDTTVLLRLIVDDDPEQRALVMKFGSGLNREYRGVITLVALLETDWALRSQFGFDRKQSSAALWKLMGVRGVEIESHDVVARALLSVDNSDADFADALIAEKSLELGCEAIVTLDQKAAKKVPSMQFLA